MYPRKLSVSLRLLLVLLREQLLNFLTFDLVHHGFEEAPVVFNILPSNELFHTPLYDEQIRAAGKSRKIRHPTYAVGRRANDEITTTG